MHPVERHRATSSDFSPRRKVLGRITCVVAWESAVAGFEEFCRLLQNFSEILRE